MFDDRKVWSRFLETTKCHATLEVLMSWMTSAMKSRMRATAPLRSSKHLNVNQISALEEKGTANHKCWLCKVSTQWTDQCQKFTSMSTSDRLKAIKENHGYLYRLKRAGRDHNVFPTVPADTNAVSHLMEVSANTFTTHCYTVPMQRTLLQP